MAQVEKETAPPTAAARQGANANTRLVAIGPYEQQLRDAYADHQPDDDKWRPPADMYDQW